jgi:hypothetical protein
VGHMDNDNEPRFTVTVRWGNDATPEEFQHATNLETNGDEIAFDDSNGKHHEFTGVSYHTVTE